jgi:hypothetical protein
MQKLMTRNIKDETLEHVPYIYNKCYKPGKTTETAMHHVIIPTWGAVENRKLI